MIKKILKRRWQRVILYFVVSILIIVMLVVYFFAPYAILKARKRNDNNTPDKQGLVFQKITLAGYENVPLCGYYVSAGKDAKGTVLLIHGIHAFKEYFFWSNLPTILVENGLNVLAFDNRGHGESGNAYITYGYKEREDVKQIVSFIDSVTFQKPLIVWGHSLGASIAINAMAVDNRIDLGVIESGYYNLNEAVNIYQGHWFGIRWRWLSDWLLDEAARIGEFKIAEIHPNIAARKVKQPVWITHGETDHRIPVAHASLIYKELGSITKKLYLAPNVRHVNIWDRAGETYQRAVLSFILNNI
jgi:uncharacterized protein